MEDIVKGLSLILEFENIILILGGVLIGVLVGALPGLSSPMAIALLIPFTITLDPVAAIAMMAALYCAGTFGGNALMVIVLFPLPTLFLVYVVRGYFNRDSWALPWVSTIWTVAIGICFIYSLIIMTLR